MIIGAGIVLGAATAKFRKPSLIFGSVLAAVSLAIFAPGLSADYGLPTMFQLVSLGVAITLEMIAIPIVARLTKHRGEREMNISILFVVALHFFIMLPTFGPSVGILGLACAVNLVAAVKIPSYRFSLLWLIDGCLKISMGALMLLAPTLA
jgi:Kef-type K+ transport system membrane component KefB